MQKRLLADAESREDSVEEVIGVDGADHLAELLECAAEREGDEFGGVVEDDVAVSLLEVANAGIEVMAAAALAGGECRSRERCHSLSEGNAKRIGTAGKPGGCGGSIVGTMLAERRDPCAELFRRAPIERVDAREHRDRQGERGDFERDRLALA